MANLFVTYLPKPIPWDIHLQKGVQTGPGTASIDLTVRAVDEATLDQVSGSVTSVRVPDEAAHLVDDPNNLSLRTNEARRVTVFQMTSREVPPGNPPMFLAPSVKVRAAGFDDAFVVLD